MRNASTSRALWTALLCGCVSISAGTTGSDRVQAAPARSEKIPDGIYASGEGPGKQVVRNDGARVVLGPRLSDKLGMPRIRSVKNDNSRFRLDLKGAGPLKKSDGLPYLAVVIDGVCLGVWSRSNPAPDGTVDLSCSIEGEEATRNIAQKLKAEVQTRKNPGHRFEVRWSPEKEEYTVGETVKLKMEIRNVGSAPFTFTVGGQQRGPRDNQYRFLAYRSYGGGKAVLDTGDPTNFGGISFYQTLKPGQTFTRSVGLDKWFAFTDPDGYRITGVFAMPLVQLSDPSAKTIWDDLAAGECLVKVVKKK